MVLQMRPHQELLESRSWTVTLFEGSVWTSVISCDCVLEAGVYLEKQ